MTQSQEHLRQSDTLLNRELPTEEELNRMGIEKVSLREAEEIVEEIQQISQTFSPEEKEYFLDLLMWGRPETISQSIMDFFRIGFSALSNEESGEQCHVLPNVWERFSPEIEGRLHQIGALTPGIVQRKVENLLSQMNGGERRDAQDIFFLEGLSENEGRHGFTVEFLISYQGRSHQMVIDLSEGFLHDFLENKENIPITETLIGNILFETFASVILLPSAYPSYQPGNTHSEIPTPLGGVIAPIFELDEKVNTRERILMSGKINFKQHLGGEEGQHLCMLLHEGKKRHLKKQMVDGVKRFFSSLLQVFSRK